MGRDRLHIRTPPEPAGSLRQPPGERAGDGLAPVMKLLPDAHERVEVDPVGHRLLDVLLQRGWAAFAAERHPLVCQEFRNRCGLPLGVQLARVRNVDQQSPGNPDALRMRRRASAVGRATSLPPPGGPLEEFGEQVTFGEFLPLHPQLSFHVVRNGRTLRFLHAGCAGPGGPGDRKQLPQ